MMKDSKLFAYCGFISALITIVDCIYKTLKNAKFTLSPVAIVCVVLAALFCIVHFIVNDTKLIYSIRKHISFILPRRETCFVVKKECIYTFISRTSMEYTKTHEIVSQVSNLKNFGQRTKKSAK